MFLSDAEDHKRTDAYWQVCELPRAVEDPEHVETFFDRNLGGLDIARASRPVK